jgi:hypothetical protein
MERAARLYRGDMPFRVGVRVMERVSGAHGEDARDSIEAVELVRGGVCRTSSGRWYDRETGRASQNPADLMPNAESGYRAIRSLGYVNAGGSTWP